MGITWGDSAAESTRRASLAGPLLIIAVLVAILGGAGAPAPPTAADLAHVTPVLATPAGRVPAVIALERLNCNTINGSGQMALRVQGSGANAGWIHSDTAAVPGGTIVAPGGTTVSNCVGPTASTSCTTTNANAYSIYGTAMPWGAGASIVAENNLSSGETGEIGTYAMTPGVAGAIGCNYPTGINVPTTAEPIISRTPLDARYNAAGAPLGQNIATLHATAYARVTSVVAPSGYGVVSGSSCATDNVVYSTADVFVDCPAGFTAKNVVFRGQHVVFTGSLAVAGGYVAFPNVRTIDVRGCVSPCTTNKAVTVSSGGRLSVNSGETGTSWDGVHSAAFDLASVLDSGAAPPSWPNVLCDVTRKGPGAGGTTTNTSVLSTFAGAFVLLAGEGNFCQTTLYLGANAPSYARVATTAGGNCSSALPCPANGSLAGFQMNNGSRLPVSWTAPSQNTGGPSVGSPFDHLALWTEGGVATSCMIGGQGTPELAGVFAMPNCPFSTTFQSTLNDARNLQLIVRTLNLNGQGFLTLRPDPAQSIVPPTPRAPAWVSTVSGAGDELPRSVKVDGDGNSYLAGSFSGSAQFGSGASGQTVASAGAMDGFLAKFDPAGALLWVQRIGSTGADEAWGLALDGAGNPIVGGAFTGSVTFGTGGGAQTVAGADDAYVAKFNTIGSLQWVNTGGGTDVDKTLGVSIDGDGRVYAAGISASPAAIFGAQTLTNAGGIDGFVAQYGADGAPQWAHRVAGPGQDFAKTVAGLPSGGAVVSGWFDGTLTAGASGGQLTAVGTTDGFAARFNADGSVGWLTDVGGTAFDLVWGSSADEGGDVYLTGFFSGAASIGAGGASGILTATNGSADGFVTRLDATGAPMWSIPFGGAGIDLGLGVAVSGSTLYISGAFTATASFGATSIVSAGSLDGFVSRLSTNGSWKWAEPMAAGAGNGFGLDAAVDSTAAVWVSGNFQSTVTFTGATAPSQRTATGDDVYLAAINA